MSNTKENTKLKTAIAIKSWLDKKGITYYTINSDLTVDVDNDVILNNKHNTEPPLIYLPVKFGKINGSFEIVNQKIASFDNFPHYVKYDLNIYHNDIKDFTHAPDFVGEKFICGDNDFTSILGLKTQIGTALVHMRRLKNNYLEEFKEEYIQCTDLFKYEIINVSPELLIFYLEKNILEKHITSSVATLSSKFKI